MRQRSPSKSRLRTRIARKRGRVGRQKLGAHDQFILEDQALVVHVRGQGLVALTSCGHAGTRPTTPACTSDAFRRSLTTRTSSQHLSTGSLLTSGTLARL